MEEKKRALKAAFPCTIPIFAGFMFVGISYGLLMSQKGFSFVYPMLMSLFIYAGSMEIVAINLLLGSFNPIYAFIITLIVNARHLFYGLSMLKRYKGMKTKFYLIYGMCDESFCINYSAKIPEGINEEWFMFFITLLNQCYWVLGATIGGLAGKFIAVKLEGLDFVMTALFVVIFAEQWLSDREHFSQIVGLGATIVCLMVFGSQYFMIPAMGLMVLIFTGFRGKIEGRVKEEVQG